MIREAIAVACGIVAGLAFDVWLGVTVAIGVWIATSYLSGFYEAWRDDRRTRK